MTVRKDMRLALDLAEDSCVPLPVGTVVVHGRELAIEADHGLAGSLSLASTQLTALAFSVHHACSSGNEAH